MNPCSRSITVEFYGIARRRAGTAEIALEIDGPAMRLGGVIGELATRFPRLAEECFDGDRLRKGYVANVGGDRFVTSPETVIRGGQCLLIMSADAGG